MSLHYKRCKLIVLLLSKKRFKLIKCDDKVKITKSEVVSAGLKAPQTGFNFYFITKSCRQWASEAAACQYKLYIFLFWGFKVLILLFGLGEDLGARCRFRDFGVLECCDNGNGCVSKRKRQSETGITWPDQYADPGLSRFTDAKAKWISSSLCDIH